MAIEPSSPKSWPATAARSAAGTKSAIAWLIRPTRSSSGSASSSEAESPSRPSASAAGPAPAAAWLSRRVRSLVACSMPDIATPASSPARSSTWIEATVVPSDCASFAWASTVASPERTMATPRGGRRGDRGRGGDLHPRARRRRAGRSPPPSRGRAGRSRGCRPRRRPRARPGPRGRRPRRAGR